VLTALPVDAAPWAAVAIPAAYAAARMEFAGLRLFRQFLLVTQMLARVRDLLVRHLGLAPEGLGAPVLPLAVAFLFLQRYWQSGLSMGAVKS